MSDKYYVYKYNGEIRRIAKLSGGIPYGYEEGEWVFMPGLSKIQYDDTDYEEISEQEVKNLIGEK